MPRTSASPFAICLSSFFAVLLLAAFVTSLPAQNPPPPTSIPGFDPAAIRDRITSRFKTALDCSDDEWKVIQPKVIKIILLQLDATNLNGLFRGGRGGPGGGMPRGGLSSMVRYILDPNAPPSDVEEKTAELQYLIDNNETSSDFYKTKLTQLRKAREKARQDLTAAQNDLTSLLTVRQEAALVQMGILD